MKPHINYIQMNCRKETSMERKFPKTTSSSVINTSKTNFPNSKLKRKTKTPIARKRQETHLKRPWMKLWHWCSDIVVSARHTNQARKFLQFSHYLWATQHAEQQKGSTFTWKSCCGQLSMWERVWIGTSNLPLNY